MRIGIVGAGHIGATCAELFVRAGHDVMLSNSRGPDSLSELARELGPTAATGTVEQAAGFGEPVVVAIPYGRYRALPAPPFSGKIVIDAMNYYPERDGEVNFGSLTSSELVARHLKGARVVKSFNTMQYKTLGSKALPDRPLEDRLALYVAGDDRNAKAVVAHLIEEIGFAPFDTGSLYDGGLLQQPGSPVYTKDLTLRQARATVGSGR